MNMGWNSVSKDEPCANCGKPAWCSRSSDGQWQICRRHGSEGAIETTDKAGSKCWLIQSGDAKHEPLPEIPAAVSLKTHLDYALFYASQGWYVFPIYEMVDGVCACRNPECESPGKHPRVATGLKAATTDPKPINNWWGRWPNANIAIATGEISNLVVIDVDPRNGGERPNNLPDTVQSLTGGGGTHDLFAHPGRPIRIRGISEGVDVKGDGGYIIVPPSSHASGRRYEWEVEHHPEDLAPVPLPEWVTDLATKKRPGHSSKLPKDGPIQDGQRNATLARIAGAMRRQGADHMAIAAALIEVNKNRCNPPLPEDEIRKIASSIGRYDPTPDNINDRQIVLVPGEHAVIVDGVGKHIIVREGDFARDVLSKLTPGTIYRRDTTVGYLVGEPGERIFREATASQLVGPISDNCALVVSNVAKKTPPEEGIYEFQKFAATTTTLTSIVLSEATSDPNVRILRRIVPYPVFCGSDLDLTKPGWNDNSGTWADYHVNIKPHHDYSTIDDILVDFPFASDADRENYIAALLTAVMRPSIRGNIPLFLVEASMERTGKTKLASDVFGSIFLGRPTPNMQVGNDDAEIEKRLLSILIAGHSIVNLDNIGRRLDSPAIASLLTSDRWQGRILGQSRSITIANEVIILATANNVVMSGEIAKRVVPIRLQALGPVPEARTGFKHPDIGGYVRENRERILGAILGMCLAWRDSGRPKGKIPFGGYESWTETIGGIMAFHGFTNFLNNRRDWAGSASGEDAEYERLVTNWWQMWGGAEITASQILGVAESVDALVWVAEKKTDPAKRSAMGKALKRLIGRPIGDFAIERRERGGVALYRLQKLPMTSLPTPTSDEQEGRSGEVRGGLQSAIRETRRENIDERSMSSSGEQRVDLPQPPMTSPLITDLEEFIVAEAGYSERTPQELRSVIESHSGSTDPAVMLQWLNRPCGTCRCVRLLANGDRCPDCTKWWITNTSEGAQ